MDGARTRVRAAVPANPAAIFATALVVAAALIAGRPAAAGDVPQRVWQVGEIQGDVRARTGNEPWRALRRGDRIEKNAEIETGAAGHLRLTGPGGSVTALPNSRLAFAEDPAAKMPATRVVQHSGRLQYAVAAADAALRVETPLLTAAIRGAAVTITVNDQNAALYVSDGAAQVVSLLTGEAALVRPDYLAWVNKTTGGQLRTIAIRPRAARPPAVKSQPSAPVRAPRNGGRALAGLAAGRSQG